MYELVEIVEDDATRVVKLKNAKTGTVEVCFDDSAVISDENFSFMKIGQQYECKIKLFGKPFARETSNSVICKLTNKEVVIGRSEMVEVEVDNSKYYILKEKIRDYLDCDSLNFCPTRKDLIQVNNTIHADLL